MESTQWMELAVQKAREAGQRNEVPVGALLVSGTEILGSGANDRERSGRTLAHAEILALEDYSARTGQWRLPLGTALYVTVEPCLMCTGALLWARVDRIYYGCSDPKQAGLRKLLPMIEAGTFDHKFEGVEGGILEVPCAELMTAFFRQKRQSKVNPAVASTINC